MRREDPLFYNVDELPWQRTDDAEVRLVGRDERGGETVQLRLPAGWRRIEGADDATVELFVLEGSLTADGAPAGAGAFVSIERGRGGAELGSERGALVYLFRSPGLPARGEASVSVLDTWAESWL